MSRQHPGGHPDRLLGWDILDRNIADEIARHHKLPRRMLDLVDETTSNWVTKTFGKWIDRHAVTQSEYVVHLGHVVLMAAQHASTVFVGRGAQFLLPADKGLRVYVIVPYDMRVANICKAQLCSEEEALRHIQKKDEGRRGFVKENLDCESTSRTYTTSSSTEPTSVSKRQRD